MRAITLTLAVWAAATSCARAGQLALGTTPGSGLNHGSEDITVDVSTAGSVQGGSAFATTTIDVLSSSPDHSIFMHLLQRTKLIPTLNLITESTVFAPTDDAWRRWSDTDKGKVVAPLIAELDGTTDEATVLADNILFHLRQHLFYHVLNYTLIPPRTLKPKETPKAAPLLTTETTLLFPAREINAPSPLPPPSSPWLPQGGTGSLGGQGQRLRIAFNASGPIEIGCDAEGKDGVQVWTDWYDEPELARTSSKKGEKRKGMSMRYAGNGAVVGVQDVISMPVDIDTIISTDPALSYLSSLLSTQSLSALTSGATLPNFTSDPHLTVFAPIDSAFRARFDKMERRYLASDFGQEGLERVIRAHVLEDARAVRTVDAAGRVGLEKEKDKERKPQVGWRETWSTKDGKKVSAEVCTIDAHMLSVELDGPTSPMTVNSTSVLTPDIFASNGVVHVVSDILLPDDFVLLNSAEKVLLTLNATRFVSLLRETNLSDTYVGQGGGGYTILAPSDDVLESLDKWSHGYDLLQRDSDRADASTVNSRLADVLRYHILPGRIRPKDLVDGALLGTELQSDKLRGRRQRLKVEIGLKGQGDANDRRIGDGDVRLGGVTVIAEPVEAGDSIIYLMSSLLEPPIDVIQTAVSNLGLSTFIASSFAASLNKFLQRAPAITYFIPTNKAFTKLGLTMNWLLLPDGKEDLRKLVRYHAVEGVYYVDDIQQEEESYRTVTGQDLMIRTNVTGNTTTITLHAPVFSMGPNVSVPSNGETNPSHVLYGDILTDTGVIHVIDSVEVPPNVDITLDKLVQGISGKSGTMADLLRRAGMSWLLKGVEPAPEDLKLIGLPADAWKKHKSGTSGDGVCNATALAPAYVLLCPTDAAFSQINLTYYLSDREALVALLKLHIIPSSPVTADGRGFVRSADRPIPPPKEGRPLAYDDELVYPTLLSRDSKYGDLAIRGNGDNGWLVGVKDARGTMGQTDVARLMASGRGTPRWSACNGTLYTSSSRIAHWTDGSDSDAIEDNRIAESDLFWDGVMSLGGGVVLIDNVLLPYEPSWWAHWGWLVLTIAGATLLLGALGGGGWWLWQRRKAARQEDGMGNYEPLEGEEND